MFNVEGIHTHCCDPIANAKHPLYCQLCDTHALFAPPAQSIVDGALEFGHPPHGVLDKALVGIADTKVEETKTS